MATYFVEVNNKFMVRIEIDGSACAAEHYFLDGFQSVWGAMAYDEKAMKTDCFRGALMNDVLTTVDQLINKLEITDKHARDVEEYSKQIKAIDDEIARLTEERGEIERDMNYSKEQHHKWVERCNANRPV